MEDGDTFIQLPLQLDPASKAITAPSLSSDATLQRELALLNTTHRTLLGLDTPNQVPAAPNILNPKRSGQVNKLRDSANAAHKKGNHTEAIRLYNFGIEMAAGRPPWEPAGLVREELANLYANRAQTHMAMQAWPEGAVDAEASVECKRQGNAKAWWRKGRCLMEMGRWEEAKNWVEKGLEVEGQSTEGGKELTGLLNEIRRALDKENSVEG